MHHGLKVVLASSGASNHMRARRRPNAGGYDLTNCTQYPKLSANQDHHTEACAVWISAAAFRTRSHSSGLESWHNICYIYIYILIYIIYCANDCYVGYQKQKPHISTRRAVFIVVKRSRCSLGRRPRSIIDMWRQFDWICNLLGHPRP